MQIFTSWVPFLSSNQVSAAAASTTTTTTGNYTGQPALGGTPVKKWRILLEQRFTVHMPLLMATSTFGLGRRC